MIKLSNNKKLYFLRRIDDKVKSSAFGVTSFGKSQCDIYVKVAV